MAVQIALKRMVTALTLLAVAGLFFAGVALAQKGGGKGGGGGSEPVPPGRIYFAELGPVPLGDGDFQIGVVDWWSMLADGSDRALSVDQPAWSDTDRGVEPSYDLYDGRRWFLRQEGRDLFAITEDGLSVPVTQLEPFNVVYEWRWAKDDSFVSYVVNHRVGPEWVLYVAAVDWSLGFPEVGEAVPLLNGVIQHDWSPTGDAVVWNTTTSLDGLFVTWFYPDGSLETVSLGGNAWNPRWSPDGSRIAFETSESSGRSIWTMHPDGSGAQRVIKSSGTKLYLMPDWSPDSQYLALLEVRRNPNGFNPEDVVRIPAAGGTVVNLTNDGKSTMPRWR